MSDEILADGDNADSASESLTSGAEPSTDNQQNATFFETYKTKEDLFKSHKELQKALGKQGSELGALRKELESTRQTTQIAEALQKIASINEKKDEPMDFDKFTKSMGEKLRDDPEGAVRELMSVNSSWNADTINKSKREVEGLKATLEKEIAALKDIIETSNPEYNEIKEEVESLMEEHNLTRAQAKQIVKTMRSKLNVPSRINPPSSFNGTRVTGNAKVAKFFSEGEREKFKAGGLTDAQLDSWEKEEMAKLNARGK